MNLKAYFTLIVASLFFLGGASPLFAHGLGWNEIYEQKNIVLEFAYADGQVLAYGEIKIYSPDNSEISYQRARTDKNGRISFIPDQVGAWKIIASDGQGHKTEALINIDSLFDNNSESKSPTENRFGGAQKIKPQSVVLGLSLLINMAFLIKLILKRRRKKQFSKQQ